MCSKGSVYPSTVFVSRTLMKKYRKGAFRKITTEFRQNFIFPKIKKKRSSWPPNCDMLPL
jgi:hypothetical protein